YSLLSSDTSNTLSTPSIPQQSAPRTISSVITKKTTGEQLCQVCLAAVSNGSHFGAKTCAAYAAFFRRTVSDEKNYICKRSQRCDVKLNYVITKKTTGEQLCQVCLAAASNGSHFGAKTCAACAALFSHWLSKDMP
ncbi:unnamed protein product, partial [Brugia pahangi]|uniref:Nuclear receptor domain-containing protein n=1 Tax=Brugia pahangi TaxID=6280 RepID=A0A0N4TTL3_BRUPA